MTAFALALATLGGTIFAGAAWTFAVDASPERWTSRRVIATTAAVTLAVVFALGFACAGWSAGERTLVDATEGF